jgi:hypothetical protein
MLKYVLAGIVALGIGGTTLVYAQSRDDGPRHAHFRGAMNAQDREAFLDARIAAVRAGLKLTPDQDKNWPAVETAVRDLVKLRADQRTARREIRGDRDQRLDPVERMRNRADEMTALAAGMKKVADAADPLYKSLDDGQKRRLTRLTRLGMRDRFMSRMADHDRGHDGRRWHERRQERQDRQDRHDRDDGPTRL